MDPSEDVCAVVAGPAANVVLKFKSKIVKKRLPQPGSAGEACLQSDCCDCCHGQTVIIDGSAFDDLTSTLIIRLPGDTIDFERAGTHQ